MTFTYDGTLNTALEKVRLEIGDTDQSIPLFTDEEIEYRLDENADDVILTAADLCEILARRFAREVSFSMDGQRIDLSDKAKMYATLAKDLRDRSSQGFRTVVVTKIDGFTPTSGTIPNATERDQSGNPGNFDVGRFS